MHTFQSVLCHYKVFFLLYLRFFSILVRKIIALTHFLGFFYPTILYQRNQTKDPKRIKKRRRKPYKNTVNPLSVCILSKNAKSKPAVIYAPLFEPRKKGSFFLLGCILCGKRHGRRNISETETLSFL
jgi:hypothetical protein